MNYLRWLIRQFYPQHNYYVSFVVWKKSLERHVYGGIVLVIRGRYENVSAAGFVHQFYGFNSDEPVVIVNYKKLHWWSDRVPKLGGQA